jgi:hypothetical protein
MQDTYDVSLLSRGDDCISPCIDVSDKPIATSCPSGDAPNVIVITPALSSTVNNHQPTADDSDAVSDDSVISVGCGDHRNSHSRIDTYQAEDSEDSEDDISTPVIAPSGIDSLLNALRTEIRGALDLHHTDKPD